MDWIAPIDVLAKVLMRKLWIAKISWDEPVNLEFLRLWQNWETQLLNINEIEIPRWNGFTPQAFFVEVHGFADASKSAYAAALFLRIRLGLQVISTLQLAKSKSAPIQWKCIPRLELATAHLLRRLVNHFISKIKLKVSATHLSSARDAKIVLCCLNKPPSTWKRIIFLGGETFFEWSHFFRRSHIFMQCHYFRLSHNFRWSNIF